MWSWCLSPCSCSLLRSASSDLFAEAISGMGELSPRLFLILVLRMPQAGGRATPSQVLPQMPNFAKARWAFYNSVSSAMECKSTVHF
jgi:hypothetical protein